MIILMPKLNETGEDAAIDKLIRAHGYHGTPQTLDALKTYPELAGNLSAAAHLIHGSSEGRFRVVVQPHSSAAGAFLGTATVTEGSHDDGRIVVAEGNPISGVVTNPTGEPVAGAQCHARCYYQQRTRVVHSAVSDDAGWTRPSTLPLISTYRPANSLKFAAMSWRVWPTRASH